MMQALLSPLTADAAGEVAADAFVTGSMPPLSAWQGNLGQSCAKATVAGAAKATDQAIRENPYKSIAIAMGRGRRHPRLPPSGRRRN